MQYNYNITDTILMISIKKYFAISGTRFELEMGFPTLMFIKEGVKSIKTYEGPQDVAGLMYFVDEQKRRIEITMQVNKKNINTKLNVLLA